MDSFAKYRDETHRNGVGYSNKCAGPNRIISRITYAAPCCKAASRASTICIFFIYPGIILMLDYIYIPTSVWLLHLDSDLVLLERSALDILSFSVFKAKCRQCTNIFFNIRIKYNKRDNAVSQYIYIYCGCIGRRTTCTFSVTVIYKVHKCTPHEVI